MTDTDKAWSQAGPAPLGSGLMHHRATCWSTNSPSHHLWLFCHVDINTVMLQVADILLSRYTFYTLHIICIIWKKTYRCWHQLTSSVCQVTKQAASVIKVCIFSDRVIKLDFKNFHSVYLHWFYILVTYREKYTSVLISKWQLRMYFPTDLLEFI